MKTLRCFAGVSLALGLSIGARTQTAFDDKVLQTIQSEIAIRTHWQAAAVPPMKGSNQNMVITQWTSKAERGVVIITFYQLESQQAAQIKLESFATSFDGKPMGDIGEGAKALGRRGGVAFRRGPVVVTVSVVAMTADRRKIDQEQEMALRIRFAKAADAGLKLVHPPTR